MHFVARAMPMVLLRGGLGGDEEGLSSRLLIKNTLGETHGKYT